MHNQQQLSRAVRIYNNTQFGSANRIYVHYCLSREWTRVLSLMSGLAKTRTVCFVSGNSFPYVYYYNTQKYVLLDVWRNRWPPLRLMSYKTLSGVEHRRYSSSPRLFDFAGNTTPPCRASRECARLGDGGTGRILRSKWIQWRTLT